MSPTLPGNDLDLDRMLADVDHGVRRKRQCALAVSIAGLALLFIAGCMLQVNVLSCVLLTLLGSAMWMGADLCKNVWTRAEVRLEHALERQSAAEALRPIVLRLNTPSNNAHGALLQTVGRLLASYDDVTVKETVDSRLCGILVREVMRLRQAPWGAQGDYQPFVIGALRVLRLQRYVQALPALRRIPRAEFAGSQMAVAAALSDCISELEAEVQQRAVGASLLRPGERPEENGSALLSPASSSGGMANEQLLRGAGADEHNSTHN